MIVTFDCPEWIKEIIKEKAKEKGQTLAEFLILSSLPEVKLDKTEEIRRAPSMTNGKKYEKKYVVTKKEYILKKGK